jgi:hypothetical protein
VLELVLEYPHHHKAFVPQFLVNPPVPCAICCDLAVPKIQIAFGPSVSPWASMPEASLDKHGAFLFWETKVWLSDKRKRRRQPLIESALRCAKNASSVDLLPLPHAMTCDLIAKVQMSLTSNS